MRASPAGLLAVPRGLLKSNFRQRTCVRYSIVDEDPRWRRYKNGDKYLHIDDSGPPPNFWFENNPILALDETYVKRQAEQDHAEDAPRPASPEPDAADAFLREPSVPSSERLVPQDLEDIESDVKNFLEGLVANVEKKQVREKKAVVLLQEWVKKIQRVQSEQRKKLDEDQRLEALRVEDEKRKEQNKIEELERQEKERNRKATDEATRKLLEEQNKEKILQETRQREDTERLLKEQALLDEDARNAKLELDKQQAQTKASDEQLAQQKVLADGQQKLREDEQSLQREKLELKQQKDREKLAREQSEAQIAKQRDDLIAEKRMNARLLDSQKARLVEQAADQKRLLQQQNDELDRQQKAHANQTAALATQLAAAESTVEAAEQAQRLARDNLMRREFAQKRHGAELAEDLKQLHDELDMQQKAHANQTAALATQLAAAESTVEAAEQAQRLARDNLMRREFAQKRHGAELAEDLKQLHETMLRQEAAASAAEELADQLARQAKAAGAAPTDAAAAAAVERARLLSQIVAQQRQLADQASDLIEITWDLAEADKEAHELRHELAGSPAPPAPAVDPAVTFEFKTYHGGLDYGDWIAAMDALCLFRDTDKSYVLFHTDWQVVLHENELLIAKIAGRAVAFRSWELSREFFAENKGSCRLIPFWNNLYYQFGLITHRLTGENLRPWDVGQRERLIGWCRTVCTAAQKKLYGDAGEFLRRSAKDRHRYREVYNSCHGCLRWFAHAGEDLHVDIRFLDKILSAWSTELVSFAAPSPIEVRQTQIFENIFEIQDWDTMDAMNIARNLHHEIEYAQVRHSPGTILRVTPRCREYLTTISKWKWRKIDNAAARAVYARIYESARDGQTPAAPAAGMLFVQAVEHHRRYTLHQGRSGEC